MNLIGNAMKSTEKGEVRVDCESTTAPLVISAADTGIGIKLDHMANLFEAFSPIAAGLTRKHEGTGLGLSISYGIIESHGGEITVESHPGLGTTFPILLPETPMQ